MRLLALLASLLAATDAVRLAVRPISTRSTALSHVMSATAAESLPLDAETAFRLLDLDGNGAVSEEEFNNYLLQFRYTNAAASNFEPFFNVDDGSCRLPGCRANPSSQYYNVNAAFDDGCSCDGTCGSRRALASRVSATLAVAKLPLARVTSSRASKLSGSSRHGSLNGTRLEIEG